MLVPHYTLFDYATLFIYVLFILLSGYFYGKKKAKQDVRYKFYFPALAFKIFAGVAFAFIYSFYYKGGDTFVYFYIVRKGVIALFHHPTHVFSYIFSSYKTFPFHSAAFTDNYAWFLSKPDTFNMVKITLPFAFFGLNSYFNTTILIAWFVFFTTWKFYLVISEILRNNKFLLVLFCLFIPSATLWSAAVLKDSYTMAGVMLIFYSFFMMMKKRKLIVKYIVIVILSAIVITLLKPYILYIFLPLCLLWAFWISKNRIRSRIIRFITAPLLFILLAVSIWATLRYVSGEGGKYSLNNIEGTLKGFQSWHTYLAKHRDESGYSFGQIDFTFWGVLKKVPASIFVTFFRPFLWRIKSATMVLGAVESFIFSVLFLLALFKDFRKMVISIYKNPTFRFFFLFCLLFGFIVGFSSYNFGALSRYKIPCMPFFSVLVYVWLFFDKKDITKKLI